MYDAKAFLEGLYAENAHDSQPPAEAPQAEDAPSAPSVEGISPDDLSADWREVYEERAAIREYEGGQAREHAEAEALGEVLRAMRGDSA